MKRLSNILKDVKPLEIRGKISVEVKGISFDSRKADSGFVFIAIKGVDQDGHQFIDLALKKGVKAVVCESFPDKLSAGIVWIRVENSRRALAKMASAWFDYPSKSIILTGVTGTNGKTTIVTLLYQLFEAMGYPVGLISTVVNRVHHQSIAATHTTPDPVQINQLLADMLDAGCSHCFMEVSSHALEQNRIEGLDFNGGIFTNITHEHLDYHQDFKTYLNVKKSFFDRLSAKAFALSNADEKNGEVMLQNCKAQHHAYSLQGRGDYNAQILEHEFTGLKMIIGNKEFHTPLVGRFNASNLMAVYAAACLLEANPDEVLEQLSALQGAPGRFETHLSPQEKIVGIIDYAHTPDALKNVLNTIAEVKSAEQQIICVIGCGGDRDKSKRPLMARVSAGLSDRSIFTSDNPRSEDPHSILEDMKRGLDPVLSARTITIENRKEAIYTAASIANAGDIILLAGKGHENYQEIKGNRIHFSDKEVLLDAFLKLNK